MAANLAYAKQHNFLALMLIQEMAKRGQFRIIKEGEKQGGLFLSSFGKKHYYPGNLY